MRTFLQKQRIDDDSENGNRRHHHRDEFARMLCDRRNNAACTVETCGTPAG
jgi:hypothetical protein